MTGDFLDQIFVRVKQLLLSPLTGAPGWIGQLASSLISIAMVLLLLITGIWYFRKMERTFADVI